MNWSRVGLKSNEGNIEIAFRHESEADEIRYKVYARSFEQKWRRNFRSYARLIAADDTELVVLLGDDATNVAAYAHDEEMLAGLRGDAANVHEDYAFDEGMRDLEFDTDAREDPEIEEIFSLFDEYISQEWANL